MPTSRQSVVLALLLGVISISFGLALATVAEVAVAPPVEALPITVVNATWALVAYRLIRDDSRRAYVISLLVGLSTALFPVIVFLEVLGPAPDVQPAHFVGVTTDLVLGLSLAYLSSSRLRRGDRPASDRPD